MSLFVIAARELKGLFLSPLAWTVLALVQLTVGYIFLVQIDLFMQWQPRLPGLPGAPGLTEIVVAPTFRTAGIVLLLVTPLLTMRLFSEERRCATLTLLLCAPISMTEIVLGKFLGLACFLVCLVGLLCLMPLSLLWGGSLDSGLFAACILGLCLLSAAFAAAGLFMSTLTRQPAIAASATLGLLLFLWLLDWASGANRAGNALAYVSLLPHFESLLKGLVNTRDVGYYLLFIATFLTFSIRRLDAERLPH